MHINWNIQPRTTGTFLKHKNVTHVYQPPHSGRLGNLVMVRKLDIRTLDIRTWTIEHLNFKYKINFFLTYYCYPELQINMVSYNKRKYFFIIKLFDFSAKMHIPFCGWFWSECSVICRTVTCTQITFKTCLFLRIFSKLCYFIVLAIILAN